MPITDFWENSDPTLFWAYRTSFILMRKDKELYDNAQAWLSGLYIHNAINVNLYNYFARKEHEELMKYLDEPIDITGDKQREKERELEKKIAIENRIRASILNAKSKIDHNKRRE